MCTEPAGPADRACDGRLCGMQIRCGDLYQDKAVEAFTACAVSDKKCVPQKVDRDAFPVPNDCALDQGFDLSTFQVGVIHLRRDPPSSRAAAPDNLALQAFS